MGQILYNLVISPLEGIIELFYLVFVRVAHSQGLAILGVGLAVNILSLPLYAKAEALQALERNTWKRLKPKVDDIKAVFQGDERWMITSTYYRQNGYHPIYALRSSFGLLLQIPFFIAAFSFIAGLPALRGVGFLFIPDLSVPDGLLAMGGFRMNLLPLAMTIINLAASAVYAKGLGTREKVQLYGMALVFLVLLYGSPSALVLYWTFNNLFSLGKNIVYRTGRPLLVLYAIMALMALGAAGAIAFVLDTTPRKRLLVLAVAVLVLLAPLFVAAGRRILDRYIHPALADVRVRSRIFGYSIVSLAVLCGLVIPLGLMASSPQEFSFIGTLTSPFDFIAVTATQAAGIFIVWPLVLFLLFGPKARSGMAALMAVALAVVLLNVFAFGGDYGTISRRLVFPDAGLLKPGLGLNALNLGVLVLVVAVIALVLALRKVGIVRTALVLCLASLLAYSGYKSAGILSVYRSLVALRANEASMATTAGIEPVYRLSTRGRNVLVFMLDRAISAFVPYMMEEDSAVADAFGGFVWYPNTLSYNGHTLPAAPPVFGGYDYTPEAMNARADTPLVTKHNEALAVLPRIFAEAGWDSVISDASWANYSWIPDNKIFERYPGVKAFNLEGRYTDRWLARQGIDVDPTASIRRNLIRFSLFRTLPMALRFGVYDGGKWWDSDYQSDEFLDFLDAFAPLDFMSELVTFDDGTDSFNLIVNNATHSSVFLHYPDYLPQRTVSDLGSDPFGSEETFKAFHVNMAALKRLAMLFKEMREAGAWDNTKIIIVADHGFGLYNPAFGHFGERAEDASYFNPLLMVKDFGAVGPLTTDQSFRTNADVPALATEVLGWVDNPFTGRPLRTLQHGETVHILTRSIYDPSTQPKNVMAFSEDDLVAVTDNIFVETNWGWKR